MIKTIETTFEDNVEKFDMESKEKNKFFNFSKNAKQEAPINNFIEFFAYKVEERKHNMRYPGEENGDKSKQAIKTTIPRVKP